jgi:hypothetical protein
VEQHGSESYFVLGEGLIGESLGDRDTRSLATAGADAAPPFRFSRMGGLKDSGKQLAEPNRRKIAEAMTAGDQTNGRSAPASPTSSARSSTTT